MRGHVVSGRARSGTRAKSLGDWTPAPNGVCVRTAVLEVQGLGLGGSSSRRRRSGWLAAAARLSLSQVSRRRGHGGRVAAGSVGARGTDEGQGVVERWWEVRAERGGGGCCMGDWDWDWDWGGRESNGKMGTTAGAAS